MQKFQGLTGKAALFLLISAAAHIIYFIVTGFTEFTMVIAALLYGLFALGIKRQMRALAYIVFIIMLIAVLIAYALNNGGFAGLWLWVIMFADLAVAICLFAYLWRDKVQSA